jgi:hypothetical protein
MRHKTSFSPRKARSIAIGCQSHLVSTRPVDTCGSSFAMRAAMGGMGGASFHGWFYAEDYRGT